MGSMALSLPTSPAPAPDPAQVPDITGIPQSSAPPSMVEAFGENPWDVQEREAQAARDEWFRTSQQTLDDVALDPATYFKGKDLSFSRNPQEAQRLAINDAFLSLHTEAPIEPSGLNRQLLRAQLAQQLFEGRGADSEEAFHAEIVKDATKRKSSQEITSQLLTEAITASTIDVADFWGSDATGKGFARWKAAAQAAPGYDPTREPDYYQAWNEVKAAARENLHTYQEPLANIWRAFKNDSTGEASSVARNAYFAIPAEDRPKFMASLKLLAGTLPKEEQPTFWANLSKQTGRDLNSFGQAAMDAVQRGVFSYLQTEAPRAVTYSPEQQQTAEAMGNLGKEGQQMLDFAADVKRVQESTYDPMKYLAPDGSWSQILEKGVYGAPGAAITSAAAAVPAIGMATFYLSSQESIYQDYRQRFQDGGMSYEEASSKASTLAPIAAVPQVLMEKLQIEAIAGKLPILEKTLGAIGDKISNRALRFTARATAGAVQEGVLEQSQDLVPSVIQDIGHALEQDIPDVQWTGKGGVLDSYWSDTGTMIVSMLPLAIFGAAGGMSSDARTRAFAQASDLEIQALGIDPAAIPTIRAGLEKGNFSGTQAIDAAMKTLDPRRDSAKQAVEALAADEQARQDTARRAVEIGAVPRFTRTPEGWTVTDATTGEEIGKAPTAAGAFKMAEIHTEAIDRADSDRVAYLATMLEAGDVVAASNTADSQTTTEFRPFETVTAAQQAAISSADESRVAAQLSAREKLNGGTGEITGMILGQSQTEIVNNVRRSVNRIQGGASILTVFHEEAHGKFREALAKGTLTKEGTIQFIRTLEASFANRKTRDGQALRFLPENDADITDTALDEAVAELMEAEILRTRKGGGRRGVSPALISRNLSAIGKTLAGPAAAFGDFLRAIRGYFGLVFARAAAVKQAIASGEVNAAEYDTFLAKLLGTTEQDQFEADAAQQAAQILEGDPFSIGNFSEIPKGSPIATDETGGPIIDDATGLPLNKDGTVTLYHGTTKAAAPEIIKTRTLKSDAERRVYLTTDPSSQSTGYGDGTVVAVQVDPSVLELDDEFPDGRKDFAIDAPKKLIKVSAAFMPFEESAANDAASFSLSTSNLAGKLAGDALSRIKDPERRARAMSRIARSMEDARLQAERLELLSGTKRLRKSLQKEAAMFEAKRAEELENEVYARHFAVLGDEDLTKLRAQPAHALLASPKSPLRGRIMSKAEFLRRHPDLFRVPAEYDGMEGVSPTVFGGTLTPDQAAEELYSAGLIREASPDAMWDILRSESKSVATMKAALESAREELRAAKRQAKQEANDRLKGQTDTQATAYSPKQEILRTLAMLDGILAAVPAEVRGSIGGYTQLARLGTNETRLEFLKERLARADKALEGWLRGQFDKEFEALLKRARPDKNAAGEKPKGKIGADVHDLFRSIEDAMSQSGEQVEAEAARLESLIASGTLTPAEEAHATLEANLIRLSGDWTKADAARREAALVEAQRVFMDGYASFQGELRMKREARTAARAALQTATGKEGTRMQRKIRELKDSGTKTGRALSTVLSLLSFEQVVQTSFGEDTAEAKALVDWERRASNAKEDQIQNKLDQLDELFTSLAGSAYKGEELRWKLSQNGAIKVGDETFSEFEAITATLLWRQEDGQRHMIGHLDDAGNPTGSWHYDQAFVDAIEAQLSPEAKAVRLHLGTQYAQEYDRLNAVFKQLNGVNMPRHKHYSPLTVKPITAKAGQIQDPVTGNTMSGTSLTPGSLRNRSQTAVAEPEFRDALQTYIAHIKQMEHWIAYAPFATEAMALLSNREVANSIEAAAGKEAVSVLRSWIDLFAQGGTRDASAHLALNGTLNRMMGRASSAALVGRASVLVMQSTQLGAALAEMPTGSYLLRLGKLFTGQLDWSAALASDYIQRRLQEMPPIVRQALDGLRSSKPSRRKYAARSLGKLIGGADALFTAGTYAMIYDYQLAQGLSPAEARDAAERGTDRVAQPTRTGARSLYENTSTNPIVRLVWNFASDARQKLMLAAYGVAKKQPISAKVRALTVTFVIGGIVPAILRDAMRDARDDRDDELFDQRNWNAKKLALASFTGPFQGFPILGDILDAGLMALFGERPFEGNLLSSGPKAAQSLTQMPDYFTGDKDMADALRDAETIATGAAPFSDEAAAAASFTHLLRDLHAAWKNFSK